jgi:predicted XRE-type DNA-binding protein
MTQIEEQLREQLVTALCMVIEGWAQADAADFLYLTQPKISALRNGHSAGFSAGRLLRLISRCGYNIELELKPMLRRYAQPRVLPTVTVKCFDRYGTVMTPTSKPKKARKNSL